MPTVTEKTHIGNNTTAS